MKKKIFTRMFILRIDPDTDAKLLQLSGGSKGKQAETIRNLIKTASTTEPGRKQIELQAI